MEHRFFVGGKDILGDEIVLSGENAAHAAVLRLAVGEEITLCDGNAVDYHCVVTGLSKADVRVNILYKLENIAEPPVAITLFQALPKAGKMDEVIEKCTQLGVSGIVPVVTTRCVAKASDRDCKKMDRWQKIALSAARQSQRGRIPKIGDVMSLEGALKGMGAYDAAFVCYEAEEVLSLKAYLQGLAHGLASIAFFIGPEGGFAQDEIAKFKENGISTVSLGPRILRTELAGPVVLANILYELEGLS
ncbi:MAG: 16S rRNA (uracil(1498)-N(3))-methyltransferase [Defluviitaleaceae bacterium]|nr:16S rRNA (uracil(1498)-N(3))-methyltransferase [Defluviitaleaceae bacterium]